MRQEGNLNFSNNTSAKGYLGGLLKQLNFTFENETTVVSQRKSRLIIFHETSNILTNFIKCPKRYSGRNFIKCPKIYMVFTENLDIRNLVFSSFPYSMAKVDDGEGDGDTTSSNSDWAELTHECLTNILCRLSFKERWIGPMIVCKSWIQACRDPSLFTVFDLESHFESGPESSLWWSPNFERKIDAILRYVVDCGGEGVKEIRIRHCSDRSLALVAERCPNLEVLSVKSCPNVTDASIFQIATCCPKLVELDISFCHEVSHESLEVIGKKCPNLKILKRNLMNWLDPSQHNGIVPSEYLKTCPQDGNMEAAAIGKFMLNLEHLELRFSKLSAYGLNPLSQGCLKLKHLDLFGCANLTSRDIEIASANLKNLNKLVKPNFYIPRSVFHTERYGHWRLYDERFQTNVFQI